MEHVAIDLGGRESQICVRSEDGTILDERRVSTTAVQRYLRKRPTSRVVLESCAESFAIADQVSALGHEPCVVPAGLARKLGVGERGLKTDQRDARKLSEMSCRIVKLPTVHVPAQQSRALKSLCGMREALVDSRTKLINTVRGWARTVTRSIPRGGATTFADRVRTAMPDRPSYVERQLQQIEHLTEGIRDADRELKREATNNPLTVRLMTVPGIGPVTALRFVAAIDDVSRFTSAHRLESYLGLTPGEHSSGDRKRRTSITKAGCTKLRWALIQAAWCTRRRRSDPMSQWAETLAYRRGTRVATVALARKLAGVLFALWRDGTVYQPLRHTQLAR